jgi:HPt (histidine-containing phosphotransfer) domain-containing protein
MRKLRQQIELGDAVQAKLLAHSLKGSAATVSATGLFETSVQIQKALADGNFASAQKLLIQMEEEFVQFKKTLNEYGWV